MTLATRGLGPRGPHITTVGFGAWAIGGGGWAYGWGAQDDAASVAALIHAVSRGVNWVDTAALYGLGHSEEVVGRALCEIPAAERPYVFTKCGLLTDPAKPFEEPRRDLHPRSIRRECEASLGRLGVETIDLYQFHWPDQTGVRVEDSWGEMARLADEGKVRWIGVSNFDIDLLRRCEAIRHVDSLQPPFSLIARKSAELLDWCRAQGTGVICYSPMQSGLLTDNFTVDRLAAMDEHDWRRGSPEFGEPRLTANLALRDALRPVAERHRVPVAAVAIGWVLAWPGVTAAIVGARSDQQVDGWLQASGLILETAELDEIAAAITRTGAGDGPARPTP